MWDIKNEGIREAITGPLGVTDEQSKAVGKIAELGTTVVTEASNLARYVGTILGTVPQDTVGILLGEPLHAVRTLIAGMLDQKVKVILARRNVQDTIPVSPSVALPIIRAAYDESRPELQELWAQLIAAAMDPARAGRVRLAFIDTLKQFDPMDAVVLQARASRQEGSLHPSAAEFIANVLPSTMEEVMLSVENLKRLQCVWALNQDVNFFVTRYGHALLRACSD